MTLTFFPVPVFESKTLANGILYIKISNFGKQDLITEFKKVIQGINVTTTKGMIIDLRHNPGGQSSISDKTASFSY